MGATRQDVVDYLLETRLVNTCCECQLAKKKSDMDLLDDLIQDVWLWVMTYDEDKLLNAYTNGHINALITRMIINNVFSVSSPYYRNYHKFSDRTTEITSKELNIPADEEL